MLNCAFGGHSPYKDYIAKITGAADDPITHGMADYVVTDELYHPEVFNATRSVVSITAYDQQQNTTAVHCMRHSFGEGRVLYFAQGPSRAKSASRSLRRALLMP